MTERWEKPVAAALRSLERDRSPRDSSRARNKRRTIARSATSDWPCARSSIGSNEAAASNPRRSASDPAGMIDVVEHGRSMVPTWKGRLSKQDVSAVK
jgi:hypothetical protein